MSYVFEALAELGAREAVPDMLRFLESRVDSYQQQAIRTLADLGAAESVDQIAPLLTDEDIPVRRTAFEAMTVLAPRRAVAAMRPLLNHSDAGIRSPAVLWLGYLDDRDSLPRIAASRGFTTSPWKSRRSGTPTRPSAARHFGRWGISARPIGWTT